MKSVYRLFAVFLAISPLAQTEANNVTLMCPQSITVPGSSMVPDSIFLTVKEANGVLVTAKYAFGIPGGQGGYVNPSNDPIEVKFAYPLCYSGKVPACYYERPSNATYAGPAGPNYQSEASCVSCSVNSSDQSIDCGMNNS